MPTAKERADECIAHFLKKNALDRDISRRLFLHDMPEAFKNNPNAGFELFNEISVKWDVPFSQVKAAGSAQIGYSYFKHHDFKEGVSDLDVALISPTLFHYLSELCFSLTKGYNDRTGFSGVYDLNPNQQFDAFLSYLARGYFRPDFMPNCQLKNNWSAFFGNLTKNYYEYFKFKKITAGVYMTEVFFEYKQASIVDQYRSQHK